MVIHGDPSHMESQFKDPCKILPHDTTYEHIRVVQKQIVSFPYKGGHGIISRRLWGGLTRIHNFKVKVLPAS